MTGNETQVWKNVITEGDIAKNLENMVLSLYPQLLMLAVHVTSVSDLDFFNDPYFLQCPHCSQHKIPIVYRPSHHPSSHLSLASSHYLVSFKPDFLHPRDEQFLDIGATFGQLHDALSPDAPSRSQWHLCLLYMLTKKIWRIF